MKPYFSESNAEPLFGKSIHKIRSCQLITLQSDVIINGADMFDRCNKIFGIIN